MPCEESMGCGLLYLEILQNVFSRETLALLTS